ncbi:PREDICTED: multiple inositol polyphosphate phosphatase 1-like [Ceratosolen solmsi marchali]|uniref:Multiple inositol polyphosphate phosphatase 1 n=1 Tax=Ceratosolen solmsi marchali TaxID=326594 RepID=A0AAJ6YQM1_9HYME|nr:PREDICTED: multiple inositol polyphosphate phosphatase 1-like [Ceratosolen solmsi marchali]
MKMIMCLILLIFTIVGAQNPAESSSNNFFPYYNTKTAYENVHGKITKPNSDCKPVQIWMLIRHGTRYPKEKHLAKFIKLKNVQAEILQNHKNKAGQLNLKTLQALSKWKLDPNVNERTAAILTPGAEKDIRSLAKRLQSAYPDLLNVNTKKIKSTDYIFRATNTPRTRDTLNFFLTTLFGNSNIITPAQPLAEDTLLTPFKYCSEWKFSPEATHSKDEKKKFQNGPEIKNLKNTMTKRLGFNHTIEFDIIETIHKMCGFEISWYSKKQSIWCALFTVDELKLLEFYQDLTSYYRVGPGRPMSAKFGCRMVKDMLQHFKKIETGKSTNEPKGIFYFGHSSSIQIFLSAFQIGKEPKLTSTSYNSIENRAYRTSLLVPFTTNIIATLYECSGKILTFKVMFHVAENMTPIPDCPDGFCDWKQLQKKLKPLLDQCN